MMVEKSTGLEGFISITKNRVFLLKEKRIFRNKLQYIYNKYIGRVDWNGSNMYKDPLKSRLFIPYLNRFLWY